jgi:hypothetical protein
LTTPTKSAPTGAAVIDDVVDAGRVERGADRCLSALLTLLQQPNATDSGMHLKLILAALRINAALLKLALARTAPSDIAGSDSNAVSSAIAVSTGSVLRRVLTAVATKITIENGGQILMPVSSSALAKKRSDEDEDDGDDKKKKKKSDADSDDGEADEEEPAAGDWDDWDDDDPMVDGAGVEKLVPEFGSFWEAIGAEFGGITVPNTTPPGTAGAGSASGSRPSSASSGSSISISAATEFDLQLASLPAPQRQPIEWLLQRYRQINNSQIKH